MMAKKKKVLNIKPERYIEKLTHAMIPLHLYEHLLRTAYDWAQNGDFEAAQWILDELTALDREAVRREYESLRVNTDIRSLFIGKPCVSCGKPANTIDHIVPITKGGTNDLLNLQPMCWDCNRKKRNK